MGVKSHCPIIIRILVGIREQHTVTSPMFQHSYRKRNAYNASIWCSLKSSYHKRKAHMRRERAAGRVVKMLPAISAITSYCSLDVTTAKLQFPDNKR